VRAPEQGADAQARIAIDTYIGMGFSNLVALAIMVTTAATLHVRGTTLIQTSREAAKALRPVAGEFAFTLFALGIVGTGLLAVRSPLRVVRAGRVASVADRARPTTP
jgi:Mn2+/Fe2+ NRAMP family transporter